MSHPTEHVCLCNFSSDERELLLMMIKRVDDARALYGPLDLDSDTRDFEMEELFENIDAPLYRGIDIIRKRRKRGTRVKPDTPLR